MKTKTYNMKKMAKWRFLIGGLSLIIGFALLFLNPSLKLGLIMIPSFLITVGIILILVGLKSYSITKEIKYDERTQLIILQATRTTFAAIIYASLVTMLVGTIQKISVDLMTISLITLFAIIITYKLSYLYFNKRN